MGVSGACSGCGFEAGGPWADVAACMFVGGYDQRHAQVDQPEHAVVAVGRRVLVGGSAGCDDERPHLPGCWLATVICAIGNPEHVACVVVSSERRGVAWQQGCRGRCRSSLSQVIGWWRSVTGAGPAAGCPQVFLIDRVEFAAAQADRVPRPADSEFHLQAAIWELLQQTGGDRCCRAIRIRLTGDHRRPGTGIVIEMNDPYVVRYTLRQDFAELEHVGYRDVRHAGVAIRTSEIMDGILRRWRLRGTRAAQSGGSWFNWLAAKVARPSRQYRGTRSSALSDPRPSCRQAGHVRQCRRGVVRLPSPSPSS